MDSTASRPCRSSVSTRSRDQASIHSDAATRRGRSRRDTDTAAAPWHADWTRRSAPERSSHTARYAACRLRSSALPFHMDGTPLCQHPQQAADQRCAPCGLTPHLCPRCLGMTPPDGRTCRRRVQRGWASHLWWRVPTLTPLLRWFCKAHATCLPTPDNHRSSLHTKAHGPRGSVEDRRRVNIAVLIGCQVSAG